MRWLRKDVRDSRVLRNHAVGLVGICALCYLALLLGDWLGHLLELSIVPLGRVPRADLMLLCLVGANSWMILFSVSFRAGECIEYEYRHQSLDMVRVTRLSGMRIMGMKATYPMVFGLTMLAPVLPLYVLAVVLGALGPAELLAVFLVLGLVSIRPAGASVIGGSVNVRALDEWKRRVIVGVVGCLVAVQFFMFGFTLYGASTIFGPASQTILLPAEWARIAARELIVSRPFFGLILPPLVPLAVLLPLLWPAMAATVHERVVEGVARLRVRANPAWLLATVGLAVGLAGYAWTRLLGPKGLTLYAGTPAGDASAALAGLYGVFLVAWTLPTAWMLAFTGRSNMGLVPCGDPPEPHAPLRRAEHEASEDLVRAPTLREYARDLTGALSVLVWPTLAFLLAALLTWRVPRLDDLGLSLRCAVAASGLLVYCYGLGRWLTLGATEVREAKHNVVGIVGLSLVVSALAFVSGSPLPAEWAALNPLAGVLSTFPGLEARASALPWSAGRLPGPWPCATVDTLLGFLLLAAYLVSTSRAVRTRRRREYQAERGPRPVAALMAEDEARHRLMADPIGRRLLRSHRAVAIRRVLRALPVVLSAAAAMVVLIAPSKVGERMASLDLIPGWARDPYGVLSIPPSPFVGAFGVTGALCATVLSIGAYASGVNSLRQEREQGTAGQLLLTPLSDAGIALGYQRPVWRSVIETAVLLVPLALVGCVEGRFSSGNVLVVTAVFAMVLVDPSFCAAWGGAIGANPDRPWLSNTMRAAFMAQRVLILMAFFVFIGDRMLRGRTYQLLFAHPMLLGLIVVEGVAAVLCLWFVVRTIRRIRREGIGVVMGDGG